MKSYAEPAIQHIILNGIFQRRNKASYSMLLELLNTDVPLGTKTPSFTVYVNKVDSLKPAKTLFPELLNYSSVEEYKTPIYRLLTKLLDSAIVKPKLYKKFKSQIINDAKIQIKRNLGTKKRYSYSYAKRFNLDNYVKLLFPYRHEKQVKHFYLRLLESENWEALTTYYALLKSHNELITDRLKAKTVQHISAQHILLPKLKHYGILIQSETDIIDLKTYAKSKLFANNNYKTSENEIIFLEEQQFNDDKGNAMRLFLFKRKNKRSTNKNEYLHAIAFKDQSETGLYNLKPYHTSIKRGILLSGFTTEEDVIENLILQIKHKTRKRMKRSRY